MPNKLKKPSYREQRENIECAKQHLRTARESVVKVDPFGISNYNPKEYNRIILDIDACIEALNKLQDATTEIDLSERVSRLENRRSELVEDARNAKPEEQGELLRSLLYCEIEIKELVEKIEELGYDRHA